MKKSTFIILLLAAGFFGHSQTTPAWVQFSAPANYANYDVQEVATAVDTIGNVYTAGSMYDTIADRSKAMLVKYNSAGVQQWIKFYDSSDPGYNGSYVVALLVDKTGNSYVCGYGVHDNANSKDFMVLKYDNTGFLIWSKYWDGGQGEADYPTCATFDAAGNIIVAGYSNSFGTTGNDMAIVKWGISGTQMWEYQYNYTPTNGEDRALAVASDKNSNIFITGSSYGVNARDMLSIKVNSAGVNQWTKRLAHSTASADNKGCSIIADTLGNSYVTGSVNDWITIKYDPAGNTLWTNSFTAGGLNAYTYKKVLLDKFNNPITAGDAGFSGTGTDLVINKLSGSSGSSMWSTSINIAGTDNLMDAVTDTSGHVYISGKFDGPLGTDMSTAILSAGGFVLWTSTYTNPFRAAGVDQPYKMAVDKNRNIIMAGLAERRGAASNENVDIITIKYSALVTGIASKTKENIIMDLYPNPSKGTLNVSINDPELLGSLITVTNLTGQNITADKISAFSQTINLNQAAKGIYFVTINNQKGSVTKKLVVE